ncbi:MAG: CBS domain-containing protein [Thermodesulfovibrionales bacterium]
MLKAVDIMRKDVVTVPPEMTVEELGRLFMERNISGAPVVDPEGRVVGIVTENDLISRNKRLHIPTVLRIFDAMIPVDDSREVEKEIKRMSSTTVMDICTRDVITIGEDTTLDEIATLMSEKKVHLLPVVMAGKVVGIVGKHEVIKGIAG